MNKEELEQEILLDLSGELSPRRQRRLHCILETSEEGRAFRDETQRLMDLTRSTLADDSPAPAVTARIMAEARAASHSAQPAITLLPRTVYAMAAVLVLGFSVWLTVQRPAAVAPQLAEHPSTGLEEVPAWDDEIDSQLEAIDELLLAMDSSSPTLFDTGIDEDTESLARELLLLEGEEI